MKHLISTTITTIALSSAMLIGGNLPIINQFTPPVLAQESAVKQPIQLKLSQAKKVADKKGFKLVPIANAQPGDIIVYSIAAQNISNRSINKLVVNQKIRPGTTYILNSATVVKGTNLTFSTDGGKSYTNQPLVNKKPAPASSYTNVRWSFTGAIAPQSQSKLSYEVQVR